MSAFNNPIIRQGAEKSLYQADSLIPPWQRLQAPDDGENCGGIPTIPGDRYLAASVAL